MRLAYFPSPTPPTPQSILRINYCLRFLLRRRHTLQQWLCKILGSKHYGLGENDQCTEKGSMKSAVNLSVKMEK